MGVLAIILKSAVFKYKCPPSKRISDFIYLPTCYFDCYYNHLRLIIKFIIFPVTKCDSATYCTQKHGRCAIHCNTIRSFQFSCTPRILEYLYKIKVRCAWINREIGKSNHTIIHQISVCITNCHEQLAHRYFPNIYTVDRCYSIVLQQ